MNRYIKPSFLMLLLAAQTMCQGDTRIPQGCRERRPHPTSKNMFQTIWNGNWEDETCPVSTLVWSQSLCRCEYPENVDAFNFIQSPPPPPNAAPPNVPRRNQPPPPLFDTRRDTLPPIPGPNDPPVPPPGPIGDQDLIFSMFPLPPDLVPADGDTQNQHNIPQDPGPRQTSDMLSPVGPPPDAIPPYLQFPDAVPTDLDPRGSGSPGVRQLQNIQSFVPPGVLDNLPPDLVVPGGLQPQQGQSGPNVPPVNTRPPPPTDAAPATGPLDPSSFQPGHDIFPEPPDMVNVDPRAPPQNQGLPTGPINNQPAGPPMTTPVFQGMKPTSPCLNGGIRPHNGDISQYDILVYGIWKAKFCNIWTTGLIWNQDKCQCVWSPLGPPKKPRIPIQNVCTGIVNITFDESASNIATGAILSGSTPSDTVAILNEPGAVGANAGYFKDVSLIDYSLQSNDLRDVLQISFRIKADNDDATRDRFQTILSNGCDSPWTGLIFPTIAVSYRPLNATFRVQIQTANLAKTLSCSQGQSVDPYGWLDMKLFYQDGMLWMTVNSSPCLTEAVDGNIKKTSCALTIGGDPLGRGAFYRGFLDEVILRKHCYL